MEIKKNCDLKLLLNYIQTRRSCGNNIVIVFEKLQRKVSLTTISFEY